MADGLGVAASAIEVANFGFKLSQSLYGYIATVSTADRRIQEIATKVDLTTAVIQEVGVIFDGPEIKALRKESAVTTAKNTLRECIQTFEEIEDALIKSRKNRFLFPFKTAKITALSASLESLKSNLSLLLHVLQHARQIATDQEAREEAKRRIVDRDEAIRILYKELSIQGDERPTNQRTGDIFINLYESTNTIQKQVQDQGQQDRDTQSRTTTEEEKELHTSDERCASSNPNSDNVPVSSMTLPSTQHQNTANPASSELASCVSALKDLISHIERMQEVLTDPTDHHQHHHQQHKHKLSTAYASTAQTLNAVLPRYCDMSTPFSLPAPQQQQQPSTPSKLASPTSPFGAPRPACVAYSRTSPADDDDDDDDDDDGVAYGSDHSPRSPAYSPQSPTRPPLSPSFGQATRSYKPPQPALSRSEETERDDDVLVSVPSQADAGEAFGPPGWPVAEPRCKKRKKKKKKARASPFAGHAAIFEAGGIDAAGGLEEEEIFTYADETEREGGGGTRALDTRRYHYLVEPRVDIESESEQRRKRSRQDDEKAGAEGGNEHFLPKGAREDGESAVDLLLREWTNVLD